MHGAAGGVAARLRQVECCLIHAQADKGRVAVNQHRQHLIGAVITAAALLGTHRAFHHRVHNFQMRRVKRQGNMHGAVGRGQIGAETHMIFHVAAGQRGCGLAFEFGKQITRQLAQSVDQHVQTASMRHADYHFFHAVFAGILNQVIQTGNGALAAFYRKAFLADIFGVQIAL